MKSTQIAPIIKVLKSCLVKLLLLDLALFLLFRYYQPLCEPCLDNTDCPPCLSIEQYFIIYCGTVINVIIGIICIIKKQNKHTSGK